MRAELEGERIDPARHEQVADVKAVTLHGLRVERTEVGWQAGSFWTSECAVKVHPAVV